MKEELTQQSFLLHRFKLRFMISVSDLHSRRDPLVAGRICMRNTKTILLRRPNPPIVRVCEWHLCHLASPSGVFPAWLGRQQVGYISDKWTIPYKIGAKVTSTKSENICFAILGICNKGPKTNCRGCQKLRAKWEVGLSVSHASGIHIRICIIAFLHHTQQPTPPTTGVG